MQSIRRRDHGRVRQVAADARRPSGCRADEGEEEDAVASADRGFRSDRVRETEARRETVPLRVKLAAWIAIHADEAQPAVQARDTGLLRDRAGGIEVEVAELV